MPFERGPQGRIHVPGYRDGCYRGRMADCCPLCLVRIAVSAPVTPLEYRIRDARTSSDHDLVGEQVLVPCLVRTPDGMDLDYKDGTVHEVHVLSGDEPDIVTVMTADDETVQIDTSRFERGLSPE